MQGLSDKRVIYGILGASAVVVGAAILSHYFSGGGKSDPLKEKLDELVPLQRDSSGHIDFEQFIKIFELSSASAKAEFADRKKNFVRDRRGVMNDKEAYRKFVIQMT